MRSILGEAVKLLAEDKIAAASQNATKLDKRIAANAKHQIPVSRQFSKIADKISARPDFRQF
ncbi:MAG: hypothetical protein WBZ35_08310 [Pseudolabrys sp.]